MHKINIGVHNKIMFFPGIGHIYAIGDCGGAMQTSKCPECGSAIGGAQHTLLETNSLAPEMDGAQHAAWSDQANMDMEIARAIAIDD